MHHCLNCRETLEVQRLACPACRLSFEGAFHLPRLARLPSEQQHLVEQFLLAGGNLKEAARSLEISYPTLRKRLDDLIEALSRLREKDDEQAGQLLDEVEDGGRRPEEAARLIKESRGAI